MRRCVNKRRWDDEGQNEKKKMVLNKPRAPLIERAARTGVEGRICTRSEQTPM